MTTTTTFVRARIDERTKKTATKVLAGMGLSMSDAIRVFLTRIAKEKEMPFDVFRPNAETIQAMKDAENRVGTEVSLSELREMLKREKN
jgi:DNA-damage-inducible protein J